MLDERMIVLYVGIDLCEIVLSHPPIQLSFQNKILFTEKLSKITSVLWFVNQLLIGYHGVETAAGCFVV